MKNQSNKYVSFVGFILLPTEEEIKMAFPNGQPVELGSYENDLDNFTGTPVDGKDSLTVYAINSGIKAKKGIVGFVIADCPAGGWRHGSYCYWDGDKVVKSPDNYNPNPVQQLG
jgi:hypothetical protein